MKSFSKEVKIGIAFIISLFMLYFGISFLKGINIFKPADSYIVVFDDVEGLTKSAPVTLNGFQVGLVSSMKLDNNNPNRVVALLSMAKDVHIPKGSKVTMDVSMLGGATIILEMNPYTKELYSSQDTIVGIRKKGMLDAVEDLTPVIETIVPRIDSILTCIHALVSNSKLQESLVNVNQITQDLAQSSKQLNALTLGLNKDVPTITANLSSISKDISEVSGQFKQIDLASTFHSIDSITKNLEHVTSKMADKDNSLGLLLNDRQLYDSLNVTIGNASSLLKDIKEQPQKYINIKVF